MKKTLLLTLLLACSTSAFAASAKNTKQVQSQTAKAKITAVMKCELGSTDLDVNYRHDDGYSDNIFLCHLKGDYFIAQTDAELSQLVNRLGYSITKVTKASFLPKQKVILLTLAK